MNQVMTCLWYIMGLWPVIYSMLLIPTGRSSRNKIPVWPFASLSVFAGAFALLPYFALWEPSALKVSGQEMEGLPLRILDSKIFALVVGIAGVGLFGAAASAGVESWSEFLRFFNSSRFIHIMSLDCIALSFFAPFWIMNDMESRRWSNKDGWGQALAFIPFLGPIVYLILRPPLSPEEG
ncbi:hypothetical protein KP509_16G010500 [Ceratopteris richardii]|nr:hypothetical protein KP509_16G010500 [Ceratopteris richardii]